MFTTLRDGRDPDSSLARARIFVCTRRGLRTATQQPNKATGVSLISFVRGLLDAWT